MENETIHVKLNSTGYNNFGTEWDDGGHQKIDKIIIGTRNSIISSIRVVYEEPDETKVLGIEHGGQSSSLKVITVKKPITQIVGTYGYSTSNEKFGITYLEFSGSTNIYGSFGKKVGSYFTFEDSNSGFTGFHGRATEAGIVAFGVYVNSSAMMSKFELPEAELRRDQGEPRHSEENLNKDNESLPCLTENKWQ